MLCLGFVFSLVGGRLVQLQAMEGPALSTHAEAFRLSTVTVPAVRGSISTADGTTLAMTEQTDLVHADPPMIIAAKRSLELGGRRAGRAARDDLRGHPGPAGEPHVR